MTTLLETEIKQVMSNFIDLKIKTCANNNGPQDLAPMYHVVLENDDILAAIAPLDKHPVEALRDTLPLVLFNNNPKFTMFMTEGYMRSIASLGETRNHVRGQLEQEFKENPAADVKETINVHGMDRSGTQVMGVVTFTYDDQGRPVFDEPMFAEVVEEMLEANVPQIFALSYQYVKAMTN
jgi:hypothetical protein